MRVERGLIQCTFQGDEIGGIKRSDVKDAMVLEVTGTVREEPRAEHGVEVVLSALSILGKPYDQLPVPLGKKYMGLSLDVDLAAASDHALSSAQAGDLPRTGCDR